MGIVKRQKICMKNFFLIFLFVTLLFSLKSSFNPKTYKFSALEIDKNVTRQQYLGEGLGKIYKNRFGVNFFNNIYPRLQKFEFNFFSNLG